MTAAFGDENVLLLDVTEARGAGLTEQDARILTEVGLPVRADQAFGTVGGEWAAGELLVFNTPDGEVDVMVLGGTAGGTMLYFLDLRAGTVGLLSLGDEPQVEQINGSLEHFVTFLLGIRKRQEKVHATRGNDTGARHAHTEELRRSLAELDPVAFTDDEAWWSMVLEHLRGRDLIAETRAYLQQCRAERDGTPADEPVAAGSDAAPASHRDRFTRALHRLEDDGWLVVDPDVFAAHPDDGNLLSPAAPLDEHVDADGTLVRDVPIAWRDGLTSRIQSEFARQGLVVVVPEQDVAEEDVAELDDEQLKEREKALLDSMLATVQGTDEPKEGVVTCLAADTPSDLCRIVRAFDELTAQGYVAEPDLWPVTSGAWQRVAERTEAEADPKAVFWNTQAHTDCFDARGDLTGDLHLQWVGDRAVIAEALSGTGLAVETPADDGSTFVLRPVA